MPAKDINPEETQPLKTHKTLGILSYVFVALIFFALGFFSFSAYQKKKQETSPLTPFLVISTPGTSSSESVPLDWKTYTGTDGAFTFKYPGDLYIASIRDDYNLFFRNEQEAQTALACLKKFEAGEGYCKEEELKNMVLNIGVTKHKKDEYRSNLLQPQIYADSQGRNWSLSQPVAVAGASNLSAELQTEDAFYSVGIQVGIEGFSQYVGKELVGKTREGGYDYTPLTQEQEKLAKKIFSTFKFISEVIPTAEMKLFHNKQLGFSFMYPASWGDVRDKIEDAVSSNTGTAGKTYSLSFNNNDLVVGAGRSLDFSAPRGGMWSDYSGETDKPKGVYSEIHNGAVGCESMGPYRPFAGYIKFNLPGKEISGVILEFEILSENDFKEYVTSKALSAKYCYDNEELLNAAIQEDELVIEKIKTGQLDKIASNSYETYTTVLKSAKVD